MFSQPALSPNPHGCSFSSAQARIKPAWAWASEHLEHTLSYYTHAVCSSHACIHNEPLCTAVLVAVMCIMSSPQNVRSILKTWKQNKIIHAGLSCHSHYLHFWTSLGFYWEENPCPSPMFQASLCLLASSAPEENVSQYGVHIGNRMWIVVFLWQSSHEKDTGSPLPLTIQSLSGIASVLMAKTWGVCKFEQCHLKHYNT